MSASAETLGLPEGAAFLPTPLDEERAVCFDLADLTDVNFEGEEYSAWVVRNGKRQKIAEGIIGASQTTDLIITQSEEEVELLVGSGEWLIFDDQKTCC